MPLILLATMMDAGNVKWRAGSTGGLGDDGPQDKTIVIEFSGDLNRVRWLTRASYGYALDLAALAEEAPILFGKPWLAGTRFARAHLTPTGVGMSITATIEPQADEGHE